MNALSTLLAKYGDVFDTLKEISLAGGPGASDAQSFMLSMENYGWIIASVVAKFVLGYISPLSLSLQSEKCDLLEAYNEAQNLIAVLEKERSDATFQKLFYNACKIGLATFGESFKPEKPRCCVKSQHRPIAGDVDHTPEEYFRISCYFPFLYNTISHLKQRFPADLKNALLAMHLVPDQLKKLDSTESQRLQEEFSMDLPDPDCFNQEVFRKIA